MKTLVFVLASSDRMIRMVTKCHFFSIGTFSVGFCCALLLLGLSGQGSSFLDLAPENLTLFSQLCRSLKLLSKESFHFPTDKRLSFLFQWLASCCMFSCLFSFKPVCVLMCVYVCVWFGCTHACINGGQKLMSNVFLYYSHLHSEADFFLSFSLFFVSFFFFLNLACMLWKRL